jgi:hypothetical protein
MLLSSPQQQSPFGVLLRHDRSRVLHFNVTEHPTAQWVAQQLVEAFPEGVSVGYLLRDRDKVYGDYFRQRVRGLGLKEVLSAPRSPGRMLTWNG